MVVDSCPKFTRRILLVAHRFQAIGYSPRFNSIVEELENVSCELILAYLQPSTIFRRQWASG